MTSRRLRRKAASVQHILAFPMTFLSCSLTKHCEISVWLLNLGFSYFPLVWLSLSWPETATLASPHLLACPLHTTTFELVLFSRDEDKYRRQGRGAEEGKKLKEGFLMCPATSTRCGWILPTNEQGSSLCQGKNVMRCRVASSSSIAFVTGEQMSCTDPGCLIAFRQTGCWGSFQEEKCKRPWSQRVCYTRPPRNTLGSYYRSIWVLVMALIFVIVIYCMQY